MRRYVWLAVFGIFGAAGGPALAEIAHPVRQGVMCLSARALAILTLPNGDSRTHQATQRLGDLQLADAGGCVDLLPTMQLSVVRSFHNTSLVLTAGQDGEQGPLYRVPNIDLQMSGPLGEDTTQSVAQPSVPVNAGRAGSLHREDVGGYAVKQRFKVGQGDATIELLQDSRISPQIFSDLWRAGKSGMVDERAAGLLTGGPLLGARLRLTSAGQAQVRDIGHPLATLNPLDDSGRAFSLHVDTTDGQASRIVEERLVPAVHGLAAPAEQAVDQGGDEARVSSGGPVLAHYASSPEHRAAAAGTDR